MFRLTILLHHPASSEHSCPNIKLFRSRGRKVLNHNVPHAQLSIQKNNTMINDHSYNCALWGLHIVAHESQHLYLQPLSTQGRHSSISTDNREAWQWVSLWQQEVGMVMSRSHLDCPYNTQTQLIWEKQQSLNSACSRMCRIHVFPVITKLWDSWWGSVRESAIVTCSKLHVHHWFSDDGQESVGERVSAALPMKSLEQSWQFLVFRSGMYLLGLKPPI